MLIFLEIFIALTTTKRFLRRWSRNSNYDLSKNFIITRFTFFSPHYNVMRIQFNRFIMVILSVLASLEKLSRKYFRKCISFLHCKRRDFFENWDRFNGKYAAYAQLKLFYSCFFVTLSLWKIIVKYIIQVIFPLEIVLVKKSSLS